MTFASFPNQSNINPFTRHMREELTQVGFQELRSAAQVDSFMEQKTGTAVLMINSVCGCAAAMARPALKHALTQSTAPDRLATVFAGQDQEATARARGYFAQVPPSSPSIALFKDGKLVYFMPRHNIEGRDPQAIAADLQAAFDQHCAVAKA